MNILGIAKNERLFRCEDSLLPEAIDTHLSDSVDRPRVIAIVQDAGLLVNAD